MSKIFTDAAHIGQILSGNDVVNLINDGFLEITGATFNPGDIPSEFVADHIESTDIFVAAVNTNCGILELFSIKGDGFVCLHTDTIVNSDLAQRTWG